MKKIIILFSFVCLAAYSNDRIVIVNTDTDEKLFTQFPSLTDTVIGLDSNLKIYYVLEKERPSYDPLTETVVPVNRYTDSIADGHKYPYYVKEYNVVRLPDATIRQRKELAILQKEMDLLMNNIPQEEINQYLVMAVAALLYERDGVNLNATHEEILTIVKERGLKVFQNRQRKKQLIQDLQINPDVDININWVE